MEIELTLDDARMDAALRRLEALPSSGMMRALAETLAEESRENIDSRKANQDTGSAWAPWSPSYRASGAPFHGQHTLLHLTGQMYRSIRVGNVTDDSAQVGAANPAPYHVHGEGRMHRDFLSVGRRQESLLLSEVERHIREAVRA